MTQEEYKILVKPRPTSLIDVTWMSRKSDRTLLYGYTCDRKTWHVYLKNMLIHVVVYSYGEKPVEQIVADNFDFVPDKRLYPETCDFEFCSILKRLNIDMPFTIWDSDREQKQYYGKVLE